ncbi:carboxypeptidase-like regulatory domain-containing protein [Flavitalea antarctica]
MNRLLILILLFGAGNLRAQHKLRNVTGVVKSAEELAPLEGVTVTIKGTRKVSGTQSDGAFYIDVSQQDSIFVFSLEGFQPKEIRITEANDYPVVLTKAAPLIMFLNRNTKTGIQNKDKDNYHL